MGRGIRLLLRSSSAVPQFEETVQLPDIFNRREPVPTTGRFVHVITLYPPSDRISIRSSPITVRLQRPDHRFDGATRRGPIRDHQLADLRGAESRAVPENLLHLREQLVLPHAEVAARQRLERREIAHREVDVHVDPTRPQQVRVHALLAVHREHHHPLLATTRANDSVHEALDPRRGNRRRCLRLRFQKPVEILHHDYRFRRRFR